MRNYSPRDYGAESQNWAVLQDPRGIVHVGNNRGVLAYDGVRWRLMPTPKRTVVRSLGLDSTGRVYVGAVGEIGYLAPDLQGLDAFVSLTEKLPEEVRAFGDVWATCAIPDGMLFQTRKYLFLLRGGQIQVVKASTTFHVAFVVGNRIFVRQREVGLEEWKDGRLSLVPGGERFAGESVFAMLPLGTSPGKEPGTILVGTRGGGLWRLGAEGLSRFQTPVETYLKAQALYSGARLADGTLALATIKGGVVLLDAEGRVRGLLDRRTGLQSDNVKALCPDRDSAIWLALDNGIARVEWPSPLSSLDERSGLKGTVWAIQPSQGRLYVATGQGTFVLGSGGLASDPRPMFKPLAGISTQSLAFLPLEDRLLLGSAQGVFEIRGERTRLIRPSSNVAISLLRSRESPSRIFVGMQGGLALLEHPGDSDRWRDGGRVPGVEDDIYSMTEDGQGRLWLGTGSEGILRITFPKGWRAGAPAPQVDRFSTDKGLASAMQPLVFSWKEDLLAATQTGVLKFNETAERFEMDPRFSGLFPEGPRSVKAIRVDDSNRIWMDTLDAIRGIHETGVVIPGEDGAWRWEAAAFRRFSESSIEAIQVDPAGTVWFGGPTGVLRYDPVDSRSAERTFAVLIRRVSVGEDLIFGGDGPLPVAPGAGPSLPYRRRALRFEFALPRFDVESASQYQVWLEGYDRTWSPWASEPQKEFTNLSEGTYCFKVRARDIYGLVSQEQAFPFRILPPWYRTGWALLLFLGLFALLVMTGVQAWTRYLLRRNEALQRKIDLATEDLRDRERLLASQAGALEQMNAQLLDLNEQKNKFLAIVAHDLRNPLTSILLSSQLIEEEDDLQEIHRRAGLIAREGADMESLIGTFLDLSVLQSGDFQAAPGKVSVPELLERILQRHRPKAEAKGIGIEAELPGEEVLVLADEKFISAVLDNLVSNAIKFSPAGTVVTIQVAVAAERIRIAVQDQGPGLTEADQKRVFGRFSRLSAQPTGGEKSVGLGLSIAKQMVEACGGRIWVESEAGKGARFVVEFPRLED
ncbi:MAG TPA: ATP-binding protein [Geothrix sp.]|nr:ATP-binding protein [Geothrix sp.]